MEWIGNLPFTDLPKPLKYTADRNSGIGKRINNNYKPSGVGGVSRSHENNQRTGESIYILSTGQLGINNTERKYSLQYPSPNNIPVRTKYVTNPEPLEWHKS